MSFHKDKRINFIQKMLPEKRPKGFLETPKVGLTVYHIWVDQIQRGTRVVV
jgi:hypothetical protein